MVYKQWHDRLIVLLRIAANTTISNMSLPNLPVELLHNVFDYLDTETILHSVRPICIQLDKVVKSYNRFKLNCSSLCMADLRFISDFIKPEYVISLTLFDNDQVGQCRVDSFLSLFELNKFTQLRSLTLDEIDNNALKQFFQHIRKCRLISLSITFRHQNITNTGESIDYLSSTNAQSNIQNLHLNIPNINGITDHTLQPVECILRSLIISTCTCNEYLVILSSCPHLRAITINNWKMKDTDRVLPSSKRKIYPQLTSLTINSCELPKHVMKFLLSLTPSLTQLKLISETSEYSSLCDGRWWERCIKTQLRLLEKFEVFFIHNTRRDIEYFNLDSIITPFRTPFWLVDKRWIFICDYMLTLSKFVLYTIPVCTADFEVLIRYDASSINNPPRLLARHWSNQLDDVCTEEVCNNFFD